MVRRCQCDKNGVDYLANTDNMTYSPRCFISYSWDGDEHRKWVKDFATRLRQDGVTSILDCWHAIPGDQLPEFMEREIRTSDFVLVICTPQYKNRSDNRKGGAGYEGDIITGEIFVKRQLRKFIPILRHSEWEEAAPSFLLGNYYLNLSNDPYSEVSYQELLATLFGTREKPPPVGSSAQNGAANAFIVLKRRFSEQRRHKFLWGGFLFDDEWRYDIVFDIYIDAEYVGALANGGQLFIETTPGPHIIKGYAIRYSEVQTGEGGSYDTTTEIEGEQHIEIKEGKNGLEFFYADGHAEDNKDAGKKAIFFS